MSTMESTRTGRSRDGRIRNLLFAILFAAGFCLGTLDAVPAQEASLYTVSKVHIDHSAKDAVTAKKIALQRAGQHALTTVFKRVLPYSAYERMPSVAPKRVEEMIENIAVRDERNSATRYIATLDYRFSPAIVRDYLTAQGLPYADFQAQKIALLPVFILNGKIDSSGRDPWRKAWLELDLEHALAPARLVRHGPSLTAEGIRALLAGDTAAFSALKEKYRSETLVIAIAELAPDASRLTTRLYGVDAAGPLALERSDRIYGRRAGAAARRAAAVALRILEGRWKLLQEATGSGAGAQSAIALTVRFSGQQQWREIRKRLAAIPGVQALEVVSLSARSADVTLRFPGGLQRLGKAAPAHGLGLENLGGVWVMQAN